MSINPNDIRAIFDQVVDLQPTERAAALGRLTDNNPALRAEVEALLASHDAAHAGNFMSSPTAATTIRNAAITETPGTRIGPYKLLQVIGEGGFGTVFLAEQSEPVRRRVALKIIKLGMDTKQVIARFEAERQALALMDHPHIARVLDAGATPVTEHGGGRPYFVMEYVVGDVITQFAANNNLDIRARLELFAQVCSAVQHAHTKGIIHRDIKPGNVLVTMTDGKPFARVIDFGIAKATASAGGLTDKTLFTEHRQLIGTPEYMSPEQAQGSPDIDTRTDVYALGVLLYELLAGDTPFDGKRLRSAAWDEMRRIIKEEDPPTPSARVTQRMKSGGSASSPSAPLTLRPSAPSDLRGELDWIVMKSLDKDRARRYETPSALAADVERHLKGEAVQAAPPSAAYRLRKFVRRNKGPVIAGSAVAAALLVGIAGTTWNWRIAKHERNRVIAANRALMQQDALAREALTSGFGTLARFMYPSSHRYTAFAADDTAVAVFRKDDVIGDEWPYVVVGVPPSAVTDDMSLEDARLIEQPINTALALKALNMGITSAASMLYMRSEELEATNKQLRTQTDAAEWSAYTANLALAQAAMDAGNWPEARERLAQCPESKRGWEWRFADLLSQSTIMHATQCNRGITSPDGTRIAFWSSGGNDIRNEVYVRPIDNPREVVTLQWLGDWGVIRTVAWSPDGKRLLATSSDDTCHIINADGSGKARMLQAGERCARFAAWSPSGSHILTLSTEGEIRVWDADESSAPRTVKQGVQSAAWSPDGSRIAGTMPDGSVVVLKADGSEVTTIHHHAQVGHWSVAWSPDGERLVAYSNLNDDSRVFVIRADGAGELLVVSGGRGATQDAAWSPDGSKLIIGFHRGPAMIMRVDAPHEPLMLSGHSDRVSSVTWSKDGARAFSSSSDGICVWDAATGSLVGRAITEPSDDSWAMSITPGSTLVASNFSAYHFGSYEAMAKLIELDAWGGPDQRFHQRLWGIPLSLYMDALMSSVREAPITGRTVTTPDGSRRIEADGRVIRFIDAKADRELAVLRTSAPVTHLTLTGEGTRLILHHADLPARVWDIRDPEERRAEMVRAWSERVPATAYLDTLLAGPTPTDVLMDAVVNGASLTPLRRLAAAEMLLERVAEINRVADATFESIMRDAEKATNAWQRIDTVAIKAHITAAAAALEPSDDLPPRAIEKVIAQAENWEYRPSEPTDKQRLAEAERVVELTREQLQTKVTELEEAGQQLQKQTDAAEWSAYTANLALAQAAMDAGNWPEARERLAQCPESKRGWEWRWLHERAHAVIGEVRGAATYVSPDASRVIATDTRSLRIATPDGTAIGSPIVFESPISELAFAPDGSAFLVALASDSTWNREYRVFTREGHPVGAPDAPPIIGRSATLSPDGQRLIAVVPTERGLATHLLDATGALIRSLASVPTEAYDTSWSGDGERVAIITPHRLDVFNRDGEPIASLDAPGDRLGKPALAPDGSRIAFVRVPGDAGQTPRTELWTMNDSTPSTLAIPSDFPQAVSFSPDSEFMYVRLWGQPTLYVTRNGVEIGRIASPDDMLSDPILSPDGSKFLLTTRTTVSIHAPDGSRIGAPIAHGSGWVDSACFAPDGESIHSTSYHRGTIEQRDLSGKLLSRASIGTSMHYVACTPDGLVLAALLNDFSDIAVATVLLSPNAALSDRSFASSISEIGRLEADARNHTDQQRDTPSQAAAAEHAAIAPHAPHRITTPDGSRLVSADADRVVRFWDTASGLEAASFRMTGDIARLELSPDGEALTMRMADGSLRMLDARPASAHAGDIEAWNSQMPPALAIVERLVESDAPTDDLMNTVLDDASLIPLRRMLAAELLTVRLSKIEYDARRALATITNDQTDKAAVLAAAAALQPSDALPPRAKEILLTLADGWEYRAPEPSPEEQLAEEEKRRRLAEASALFGDFSGSESLDAAAGLYEQALRSRIEYLGVAHPRTVHAIWASYGYLSNLIRDEAILLQLNDAIDRNSAPPTADELSALDLGISLYARERDYQRSLAFVKRYAARAELLAAGGGEIRSWLQSGAIDLLRKQGVASDASMPDIVAALRHVTEHDIRSMTIAYHKQRLHDFVFQRELTRDQRAWFERDAIWLSQEPPHQQWNWLVALSHLRLGKPEVALHQIGMVKANPAPALDVLVACLAHAELGQSSSARSALSRARTIMSDPAALDEYGRPWSENSDAQALLKEAEELIGHETQDDRE